MFKRSLVGLVVALMGVASTVVPASSASPSAPTPAASGVVVQGPVHHDISPPMASVPGENTDVPSSRGRDRAAKQTGNRTAAPSIKSSPSATLPVTAPTSSSFEGIGSGLPGYTVLSAPPDPNGAVSPLYYVEIVNSSYAIFNRAGGLLSGPFNSNTLFTGFGGGCQVDNDGDGTVIYDQLADRWLISQFAVTTSHYLNCVAVSTTNDPRGTWARYSYLYTNMPDYPKFAMWPDAYYMSANMFAGGTTFVGPMACAYDRARMLAGQVATQQCIALGPGGALLPSSLDGTRPPPTGSPDYYVGLATSTTLDYWKFHVDWTSPSNSTFAGPATIPVPAYTIACGGSGGTCVPQKGTTNQLDTLGDRVMYRLAYRNFGDHEALVVNHSVDTSTSVGVRWYELRTSGGNLVLAQSGTHAPDSNYRWMGSMAMDSVGDIGMGYSTSGTTMNPAIRYTGRTPTDPAGTLQTEGTIISGTGSQTGTLTRWGDYTSMLVDPVDDCTFWYTNQYLAANGTFNWHTRVGTFKFPGCLSPPTGLSASPISSSQIGLSWIASSGATTYKVQRSPDGSTGWTQVGSSTTTTFTDTGLSPSTIYYYRVLANNTTGDSVPSAVTSATTAQVAALSASPSTVNPGSSTTVSWSGITSPSATDWIGLYSAGAPESARVSYRYTGGGTSGSLSYSIPASLSPGTYDVRLHSNDTYNLLATTQVTLQAATVSASPGTVNPGSSTTVSWSGISSPSATDWIGLYSAGAPESARVSYRYTGGGASGSLSYSIPASLSPGTYDLRLHSNDTYNLLATTQVTVQAATVSASPGTVNPGSSTTVSWSGISSPSATDWIGLYSSGAPESARVSYRYTGGGTSGSLSYSIPASLSPGTYDVRLHSNNTYNLLATTQVTVQAATVSASPGTVNPGSSTTASWSGISSPSATDWIGLYSAGAPESARVSYRYTGGGTSGSLSYSIPASLSPGTYDLRLHSNDTYNLLATTQVTVQAATVSASPSTVNPGRSTTVSWSGISSPSATDWIGLYSAGAPESARISYRYTGGGTSGSLSYGIPASLSPGTYDVRLHSNDTYNLLATTQVTVQ